MYLDLELLANAVFINRVVIREDGPPSGLGVPPKAPIRFPKALLKEVFYNISEYNDLKRGGHYIALEEPEIFAENIRSFDHAIKTKRLY